MRCDGFPIENYSFFVLGNLPEQEGAEIRSHLERGCEVCRAEIARSQGLWHAVALSTPLVEPSRELRRRVRTIAQPVRARWSMWSWPQALTATALAVATFLGGWISAPKKTEVQVRTLRVPGPVDTSGLRKLEQENQALKVELANAASVKPLAGPPAPADTTVQDLREQLAQAMRDSSKLSADLAAAQHEVEEANRKYLAALQPAPAPAAPVTNPAAGLEDARKQTAALLARTQELERQVAEYKVLLAAEHRKLESNLQLVGLLTHPDLSLVHLRSTDKGRNVEGHALVAGGSQVIFYASQLPALPAGRTYQLWLIRAQSPAIVSAGTFRPDASNRAALQFSNRDLASGITAIAVTDEPAGGSEKPTGHKLLVGQKAPAA